MESLSLVPKKDKIIIFILTFLAAFIAHINATNLKSEEYVYEYDRVIKLPGQPTTPNLSQFSGYITVNEPHGRALFYWFFESLSQPTQKPLLLWLNGGKKFDSFLNFLQLMCFCWCGKGPGCSSIGYGAAVELGPLRVGKNGAFLEFNHHSWNKEANLLFVESPVGVGFSYSNTSSDFTKIDDSFVAEDTYNFVVKWMERFPQFKDHDFFISGESYAGHYVPQLAELIYDRNKKRQAHPYINLKGFIVGNPETNDYFDYKGLLEYAWSHAVVSDQEYDEATKACDFKLANWSDGCNDAMNVVFDQYKEIDIYNIYAPSCPVNRTSKAQKYGVGRMGLVPGGYDPCYSTYTAEYFNRRDVQVALNVDSRGVKWRVCNDSLFQTYNYTVSSVLPIYKKLIKGGLKIWIYSGDADGRVPVIGSRYCIEALQLPLKTPWMPWYYDHQVGGRIVEYEGLSFITVRGAGHLVPLNKPKQALALIRSYLSAQPLSTRR